MTTQMRERERNSEVLPPFPLRTESFRLLVQEQIFHAAADSSSHLSFYMSVFVFVLRKLQNFKQTTVVTDWPAYAHRIALAFVSPQQA
jgi:hypothetical protein